MVRQHHSLLTNCAVRLRQLSFTRDRLRIYTLFPIVNKRTGTKKSDRPRLSSKARGDGCVATELGGLPFSEVVLVSGIMAFVLEILAVPFRRKATPMGAFGFQQSVKFMCGTKCAK